MKKKSTSQSAFLNLRVLIGLFVALTGASLLALGQFATAANPFRPGVAASSHARTTQAQPQYKVTTNPITLARLSLRDLTVPRSANSASIGWKTSGPARS